MPYDEDQQREAERERYREKREQERDLDDRQMQRDIVELREKCLAVEIKSAEYRRRVEELEKRPVPSRAYVDSIVTRIDKFEEKFVLKEEFEPLKGGIMKFVYMALTAIAAALLALVIPGFKK